MERESAVREILQSIGPLFPEDAAKARAARKEALAKAAAPADAVTAGFAPKPVLASQVDNPGTEKTEVTTLAAVLARLTPPPPPTSVRDAIPGLVRPAVPEVPDPRAALVQSEPPSEPTPLDVAEPVAADALPAFTELPADPVAETEVAPALVEPEDVVFVEPSAAEIQEALALAIEAQRGPAEPKPRPAVFQPVAPAPDSSEDDHDAFVYAIADAILPARPYPRTAAQADRPEALAELKVADLKVAEPAVRPAPSSAEPAVVPAPVAAEPAAVPAAPVAAEPKTRFKRVKPKKAAEKVAEKVVDKVAGTSAEASKPAVAEASVEPAKEAGTHAAPALATEDDELIRQIRVHRADMIDVDDQIARIDQEIAAEQQAMAHYVSLVEQKNAHRSRLLRLRTNTQRFVDALQLKAEPLKRSRREEKKSA